MLCVIWLPHRPAVTPSLSLSSGLPIPWDTTLLKLGQLTNTPTVGSKCSSEKKSFMPPTLNTKLEMIKLSEEGKSKAEIGQKIGLLCQTVKLSMQRKSIEGNWKCYSSEHIKDNKMKRPYCQYRESFSGLDRRSNQPQHSLKAKV